MELKPMKFAYTRLNSLLRTLEVTNLDQYVALTSGTLSPIDLYPKLLDFKPVIRCSLNMTVHRPCICPMVVTRGSDQMPVSSRYELRADVSVVRNYGALLVGVARVVPDGMVCFFTSYSYMESVVS